ncbi:DUF4861 family protein [Luteolibacter algae]|uniref:DUF4861 family protein n=1 Tax=Luteolibacter algae TaxID=454151 RepID=A0ABW5DB69_9BACT
MKIQIIFPVLALAFLDPASIAAANDLKPATFCRFVQERQDDFAWENDKVAFRAYGPALRAGKENSGIDCWLKRVPYPVIDKWYTENKKGKSYHKDHGEGYDPYHVGSSAGTGGTGIWLDGKREPLETFTGYEVIESAPEVSRFKLSFEREIGGVVYREEKTITIRLGERLFEARSVFTRDGKIAVGLPICIGVTTHDGKAEASSNTNEGWIACWETIEGSGLGTAARMEPSRISEIKEVESDERDQSHIFLIANTNDDGAIDYRAGYGWEKAGEITTREQWETYLNEHGQRDAD